MKAIALISTQNQPKVDIPEPMAGILGGGVTGALILIVYLIFKEGLSNWKRKDESEDKLIETFVNTTTVNKNKMFDNLLNQHNELTQNILIKNESVLASIQKNQEGMAETQARLITLLDTVGNNSVSNSLEIKSLLVRLDNFTQTEMNRFLMAQTNTAADTTRKFTIIEKSLESLHQRLDLLTGRATIKTMPLPGAEDSEL